VLMEAKFRRNGLAGHTVRALEDNPATL
jgi:hypothetical protein